jgi:transglutaminase-like putative cysteine protease
MKYRVSHVTRYRYSEMVSMCHNLAHLLPRTTLKQTCLYSELKVSPLPEQSNDWEDLFGNRLYSFSIHEPHRELEVRVVSEIEIKPNGCLLENAFPITWEETIAYLQKADDEDSIEARQFVLESDFVEFNSDIIDYAEQSFTEGRPLLEAVEDLMGRIHRDFTYDPGFTNIATPLQEVFEHKRGVCQDFAHLAIACLRSHGLAARYVSGYLETEPPEGQARLEGADASHAWFSVYVPHQGWRDFDPTNDQIPAEQHITAAWGRDYADVAPLKGVIFGGGTEHKLDVAVDVERI